MNRDEFLHLYHGRGDRAVRVGAVDERVRLQLGAITYTVHLSPETIRKQRQNHPELSPEHYQMAPIALRFGAAFPDRHRSVVILYEDRHIFDVTFKLALKTTVCGTELYLTSFHIMRW